MKVGSPVLYLPELNPELRFTFIYKCIRMDRINQTGEPSEQAITVLASVQQQLMKTFLDTVGHSLKQNVISCGRMRRYYDNTCTGVINVSYKTPLITYLSLALPGMSTSRALRFVVITSPTESSVYPPRRQL